jgi:hypothetical protein
MFRFTIRELVLLTLVVAMGVGWWIDHTHLAKLAAESERNAGAAQLAALMNPHLMDILDIVMPDWPKRYPLGSLEPVAPLSVSTDEN